MGAEVIVAGKVRVYYNKNYKADPPIELLKTNGLSDIDPISTDDSKNSLMGSPGIADDGTAKTKIPFLEGSQWKVLGTDYVSEDGVSQNFSETQEDVMIQASNLPIKTYRTVEDKQISLTVYDMSSETFALIHNNNKIYKAAATAPQDVATDQVMLEQGVNVDYIGLIVEGTSPAADIENPTQLMYFYYPRVAITEMGEFSLTKTATGISITFKLFEDDQSTTRAAARSEGYAKGDFVWNDAVKAGRFVSTKNVRQAFKLDQKKA